MSFDKTSALVVGAAAAAAIGSYHYMQKSQLRTVKTTRKQSHVESDEFQYQLYEIDYTMHAENRMKLISRLKKLKNGGLHDSAVVMQGGVEVDKYDTDTQYAFRQESFFQFLFGAREPGCYGAIDVYNNQSILFVPRLSAEWELWCGKRKSLEEFKQIYLVDEVHYVDEIASILESRRVVNLYLLHGVNTDSGLETATTAIFEGIEKFDCDTSLLHPEIVECRVFKSEKELDLMRFVNKLSSDAHIQVMKTIQPNMMEFHSESTFLHHCYMTGGSRLHAYTCICGSGNNASALHYGHAGAPNDHKLNDGDLFLNDMGAELHCYASDITCTFPINGKFTQEQRMIYEGVLKSHDAVINASKRGVEWTDMHNLSHRVLTEHLLEHKLFQNGTVDELMEHEISAYFYPHGLGHLMGLDVHDVGGYIKGIERSQTRLLRKLRCGRKLETSMVVTVEPGCYFIDAQLDELLADPKLSNFVNLKMLESFRGTGGVRIESDIIITDDGCENMTQVPRTVLEIESLMQSKA